MQIERLDHFTIRTSPEELERVRAFYVESLGLTVGARPAFRFDGYWLYANGRPIVHLAANSAMATNPAMAANGSTAAQGSRTGKLDHISFRATGLEATREKLSRCGLTWEERPVPGFPLHQLFLTDPVGINVELTFDVVDAK